MRYLLDTSVLIRWARRDEACRARIHGLLLNGDELGCCDVTLAEFYAGVAPGVEPLWDRFLDSLTYWQTTRDTAMRAAHYRRTARLQNHRLETADVLIAAVAHQQRATLLTANARDFPMPDVRVVALD
ncbi:MAG: PIN domain-containing protein [Dehalococcoidia bacterium]|nr:PIN domain-containing protein [Dehalococcoidia bacterium]